MITWKCSKIWTKHRRFHLLSSLKTQVEELARLPRITRRFTLLITKLNRTWTFCFRKMHQLWFAKRILSLARKRKLTLLNYSWPRCPKRAAQLLLFYLKPYRAIKFSLKTSKTRLKLCRKGSKMMLKTLSMTKRLKNLSFNRPKFLGKVLKVLKKLKRSKVQEIKVLKILNLLIW